MLSIANCAKVARISDLSFRVSMDPAAQRAQHLRLPLALRAVEQPAPPVRPRSRSKRVEVSDVS